MIMGNEQRLTVLVTGTGAPLGVSIFKAFRQSALRPRIIATDADPLSVGLFRADAAYVLPRIAEDERLYLRRLEEICLRERVAAVCFGSEIEMRYMAPHIRELERATGARLILNEPRFLDALLDKWQMTCHLRERNLPVPDTVPVADAEAVHAFVERNAFPYVLKPRDGSGSKGKFVLRNDAELEFFSRYVPNAVLQEYLFPDDEEYTVGIYKSPRTGYVGQIVFKRALGAGLTYKAEVVFDDEIESVCRRVVESFDVWGPINVQLRKTAAGVRVFEINLRFSSSTVMRASFGFNEAELCLRDVVLGEAIVPPKIRPGFSLRYWDEVYLAPDSYLTLQERGHVAEPGGSKMDDF
jgi:carbamoyl-phosphate synthase large subunit